MKYESEYWYIGSTEPKSDTTKYRMVRVKVRDRARVGVRVRVS